MPVTPAGEASCIDGGRIAAPGEAMAARPGGDVCMMKEMSVAGLKLLLQREPHPREGGWFCDT